MIKINKINEIGDNMGYWDAVKQMRKLEDAGYLRKGYKSCSDNEDIYYRFFASMKQETLDYLKEKINQALIDEKVIFNIGYALCIMRHKPIVKILENSMSYPEMSNSLKQLPYTYISTHKTYPEIIIYGGKEYNENITDEIIYPLFKYGLSNNLTLEISGENKWFYIRSKKCENLENEKQAIDKLF